VLQQQFVQPSKQIISLDEALKTSNPLLSLYFANSQTAAVTPEDEYEPFFFAILLARVTILEQFYL